MLLIDFSGGQTVYTPAQSLKHKGANCIDGTLVFASAVSAIGMRPYIVLVPEHAFVSVETYPNSGYVYSVETTMIGSGATFDDALIEGNTEHKEYSNQNQIIAQVDVNTVLSSGVKSLPHKGEFNRICLTPIRENNVYELSKNGAWKCIGFL